MPHEWSHIGSHDEPSNGPKINVKENLKKFVFFLFSKFFQTFLIFQLKYVRSKS